MPFDVYHASVPVLLRGLDNLSAILRKAEEDAVARGIAPETFLQARLAPDMFPLQRQVQIVSDTAKGCAARLAGAEVPSYADDEQGFDELRQRLAKTSAFILSLRPEQMENGEEREITLKLRGNEVRFRGQDYLCAFALPNFYFHLAAAYAILRHNGVPLGKADYLGELPLS
ncbi:DUF1993 domain-containing protein [Chromobacterium alticapitis]|uniref:DUF1993 domain-containing protein n=1 Tax=Chromobacterium alticapitis TaxID=2073169 RepID=A0A2S5DFW7_9NEIS|nr:DUF1993 domain-containing protein [Chromobacterium alticapitis]POZ61887.1 DUF1993 domain-containing protein [Chromobacterium alticapitis]